MYTSVVVRGFKSVLVLNKSLQRNDVIREEYVNVEMRDTGLLQQGFVTDLTDVINKQVVRNIPAGSVLNRQQYADPSMVKRGDKVNIQSAKTGVLISALGMAMTDGVKGQKINVKNVSSQRVIQATVVDSGLVVVYF